MNWEFHTFQTLDTSRLFELMKLRTDVFVVEQQCAYPELDNLDNLPSTIHLLGYESVTLAAYARAMPTANASNERNTTAVRIGRVVVAKPYRGTGLAVKLMNRLMSQLCESHSAADLVLSAQEPIVNFYEELGFTTESEAYLEDGIPHVDMRKKPVRAKN